MSLFKRWLKKGTLFLVPISIFSVYENINASTNAKSIEFQLSESDNSNDLIVGSFELSDQHFNLYHDDWKNEEKLFEVVMGRKSVLLWKKRF